MEWDLLASGYGHECKAMSFSEELSAAFRLRESVFLCFAENHLTPLLSPAAGFGFSLGRLGRIHPTSELKARKSERSQEANFVLLFCSLWIGSQMPSLVNGQIAITPDSPR
jgi:hypothetical protein